MSDMNKQVDEFIESQHDWQKDNLISFRVTVHDVEPAVQEALKWSVPVFSLDGKLVCAMSTFKTHTKYNFFMGAELKDEHSLFNNGLDSKKHRAIDLKKGDIVDKISLKDLLSEAFSAAKLT